MEHLRDGYNNKASTKPSHIQYLPWQLEITGNYSGIWQLFPRENISSPVRILRLSQNMNV